MTAADRLRALVTAARDLDDVAERIATLHPSVVVEVELVPAPGQPIGPVVDVVLVPVPIGTTSLPMRAARAGSSRLARLPTLAQLQAVRRAQRKDQLGTKLDRAIANKAARLLDAKKLRAWALAVKVRDQWKDRKTGIKVHSTRQLDPLRAEAHHLEPKSNPVTRHDVRNGICLSFQTHYDVEHFIYRIEGTVWFRGADGCRYIDGTFPVHFVRL